MIAATLEIGVAAICFFRPAVDGLLSVAGLSILLATYRITKWLFGVGEPCSCLGNLTDALNISPQLADNIMKGVLAFMFVGSVSLLILHWRGRDGGLAGEESSVVPADNA